MDGSTATDKQARVEQLLRDAHIQRMRQQWAAAETLCREALELDPDDVMGQEMLGDLLLDKGSCGEALESYRKAFEKQPEKVALEEKIARAVLLKGEEERQRLDAELMLSSPGSKLERKRSATIATLLSLLCPGAGQLFTGQYVKGGILLGVGVLSLFLGGPDLIKFILGIAGILPKTEEVVDLLAMLGLVGVLVWLYSLLDAAGQAGRSARKAGDL